MGWASPIPNHPHPVSPLRPCLALQNRRAGMRLTPAWRQRKNVVGRSRQAHPRADGCQHHPNRGGAGVTLRIRRPRPLLPPPALWNGTIEVRPAFSGRDRGRGDTAHPTRTRYLRVTARARVSHVPKGSPLAQPSGHPPSRPSTGRPGCPSGGRSETSMRHSEGTGDNSFSHTMHHHRIPPA